MFIRGVGGGSGREAEGWESEGGEDRVWVGLEQMVWIPGSWCIVWIVQTFESLLSISCVAGVRPQSHGSHEGGISEETQICYLKTQERSRRLINIHTYASPEHEDVPSIFLFPTTTGGNTVL